MKISLSKAESVFENVRSKDGTCGTIAICHAFESLDISDYNIEEIRSGIKDETSGSDLLLMFKYLSQRSEIEVKLLCDDKEKLVKNTDIFEDHELPILEEYKSQNLLEDIIEEHLDFENNRYILLFMNSGVENDEYHHYALVEFDSTNATIAYRVNESSQNEFHSTVCKTTFFKWWSNSNAKEGKHNCQKICFEIKK